MKSKKTILPIIVLSQFCCTSLWFAGNAVIEDLIKNFNLEFSALGNLTSAVQFGFIFGTFVFALLTISDRFAPSKVFFFSAIVASVFNLLVIVEDQNLERLLILRFITGFFLAGIYPVGMKIASDYYKEGLGKSLGFLVGALVLGTAFPHLLKGNFDTFLPWKYIMVTTSILAVIGGSLILLFVSNGPYRESSKRFDIEASYKVFKNQQFRAAAFGYFGHMWELYSFWAFTPLLLVTYAEMYPDVSYNIPLLSFAVIAVGGLACVLAGYLSQRFSVKRVAGGSLFLSCLCCVLSPLFFQIHSQFVFIIFLMFWGMAVIADSPMFSTLVAQNVNESSKGTALTIVNCIGFAITIISIQVLNVLIDFLGTTYLFTILAVGPIVGLCFLFGRTKAA